MEAPPSLPPPKSRRSNFGHLFESSLAHVNAWKRGFPNVADITLWIFQFVVFQLKQYCKIWTTGDINSNIAPDQLRRHFQKYAAKISFHFD